VTDLDEALVDYLRSQVELTTLVGNRIFPDCFSQGEQLPAIAYTLEDDLSQRTLCGPSGLRSAVYQINVWADTRREAMAVARLVRAALDLFHGRFKDIPIPGSFLEGMSRECDPDTGAFCVSMRFTIHYRQA
jgi:hypothetical protein